MRRNIKVIEINGLRGIFTIIYAIVCAAAGFIVFPAWLLMTVWNQFATYVYELPHMNIFHGFMLYAILILIYFATKSHKSYFGITSTRLSESHISALMKDIEENNRKEL